MSLLGAMSAEIGYEYPVLRQELSWTGVDMDSEDDCFVFYSDLETLKISKDSFMGLCGVL